MLTMCVDFRISPGIRWGCYEPLDSTHPDTQGIDPTEVHCHRAVLTCGQFSVRPIRRWVFRTSTFHPVGAG